MTTLYKLDSKGKLREWTISTVEGKIIQSSGLVNGQKVVNEKEATPKNIGKSNETTPAEQAILEMESSIKEQLRTGYCLTKEEAEKNLVILPMLAHSYNDHKHKIDWTNCFIQPKLDGQRCLAFCKANGDVTLMSRDGKEILTMDHIKRDLANVKEDVILDGELYVHGVSFQENMKLIKKYRKGETEKVKYHVYDVVSQQPFRLRKVRHYIVGLFSCEEVSTYQIKNEQDLKTWHESNIGQGYEGSIIRYGEEGYKVNGRSANLLKYKDFLDMDLVIEDIVPSEQRPTWGQPMFSINGKKFSSGMKYSHEDRIDFLTNKKKYINKLAVIRYFELSDEGTPRFPVMIGIRQDL